MNITEMATTACAYREIQAEIKALEEQAEALKQQMIREMDSRKLEALEAGEYTIRWSLYQSSRLDTTALKQALPDVAERFTKQTTATRFQVA
jgi:predicted phage-related endonuclease